MPVTYGVVTWRLSQCPSRDALVQSQPWTLDGSCDGSALSKFWNQLYATLPMLADFGWLAGWFWLVGWLAGFGWSLPPLCDSHIQAQPHAVNRMGKRLDKYELMSSQKLGIDLQLVYM